MKKNPFKIPSIIIAIILVSVVTIFGISYSLFYSPVDRFLPVNITQKSVDSIDTQNWLRFESSAPFVFHYPTTWGVEAADGDKEKQGIHLSGPEGEIYLYWGKGFGGACDESLMGKIEVGGELLPVCNEKLQDGIEEWRLISKELSGGTSFNARAVANIPADKNRAILLKIFSTVIFNQTQK